MPFARNWGLSVGIGALLFALGFVSCVGAARAE